MKQRMERMVIEDRINSNHHPVEVWIKEKGEKETREERERGNRSGGVEQRRVKNLQRKVKRCEDRRERD